MMSLLSWERGLKYYAYVAFKWSEVVAPLVGAWIEIANKGTIDWDNVVAPLVGAWIEINNFHGTIQTRSLLSWERGLKYTESETRSHLCQSRSSRGSVD